MNPTAEDISTQRLQCPNCGGALEIRSALDTYQNISQRYAQGYAQGFGQPFRKKSILPRILLILAALMAALYAYGSYLLKKEAVQPEQHAEFQITEPDPGFAEDEYPFGDRIDLASDGNNVYTVSDGTSDKQLVWDVDADSYYDEDSDCWVWYNTDVEPPIWQYWYEGISSDFGDYGWMEHDEDGWFIEESYGNWIELPSEYDTEALWYIEE
ncbi:MAG: hypothetical protein J5973_02355 [Eubacterium sp.]|nr:hypothetical protein [Eubacterium sp.]